MNLQGSIIVRTASGSVYRFSPANKNGIRDVSKEKGTLPFSRGQIIGSGATFVLGGVIDHSEPIVGEALIINPEGNQNPNSAWFTTTIVSIEQA